MTSKQHSNTQAGYWIQFIWGSEWVEFGPKGLVNPVVKVLKCTVDIVLFVLIYAAWAIISWWLQMAWCQIGTRPSATTMLTPLLPSLVILHTVWAQWHHDMGTLPIFVAVCVGDPPVIGTFPTKRDSNPNFDVTFLVSLNDLLHSQVVSDISMMTLSNGNISRVTGHLCREFTGDSPHKGQWRGALMFSLICVWINDWVNNREAGDFRRYCAHYDVIVMTKSRCQWYQTTWLSCTSV